jgi:hypothetical protein
MSAMLEWLDQGWGFRLIDGPHLARASRLNLPPKGQGTTGAAEPVRP